MRMDCRLTILTFAVIFALSIFGAFQFTLYSVNSTRKTKVREIEKLNGSESLSNENKRNTAMTSSPSSAIVTDAIAEASTISTNDTRNISSMTNTSSPQLTTLKYYILEPPEYTDNLLLTDKENQSVADTYYQYALNEESAEIWLHRAFRHLSYEEGHTLDPMEADVFLIAGYLHLNLATPHESRSSNQIDHELTAKTTATMIQCYKNMIVNKTKPHLLLTPTWNPGRSRNTGVAPLAGSLEQDGVNMWSVGIERNRAWQGLPPSRIIPIPYVVNQSPEQKDDQSSYLTAKLENSVFYTGDARRNAQAWGGCFREAMILPLKNNSTLPNIDVRIVGKKNRLDPAEYNHRILTNEYCLILCGDTPTSRSMASAWVSGCIPIIVGSRLRGLCEPPCQARFGWAPTGRDYPHLVFSNRIPWKDFPEVNETEFTLHGEQVLQQQVFAKYDTATKQELRRIMAQFRDGWIYGWGDPVTSTSFGQVHKYLWEEFQQLVNDTS